MAITQEEWTKRHRQVLKNLVTNNRPLRIAARTAMKDMSIRIFIDGRKSDGSLIGQYDTKTPFYVNPKTSAGSVKKSKPKGREGLLPTKGKTGEHVFKNGKEHKTTYVNNYKDYRNRIGKPIDKVTLVLSGDLQSDFCNAKIVSDKLPANPAPKKVTAHEYIITLSRKESRDKREGLEDKYGIIFHSAKEEVAKFIKIADQELRSEFAKAGL